MKRYWIGAVIVSFILDVFLNVAIAAPLTKKSIKKIANQTISKRAAAFKGPMGPVGDLGPIGPAGPAAVQSYARILADGMVVPSRSVGIVQANVSLTPDGYCFNGLPPINGAQVTVDYFETISSETAAFGVPPDGSCQGLVKIFDNGTPTTGGFLIILY